MVIISGFVQLLMSKNCTQKQKQGMKTLVYCNSSFLCRQSEMWGTKKNNQTNKQTECWGLSSWETRVGYLLSEKLGLTQSCPLCPTLQNWVDNLSCLWTKQRFCAWSLWNAHLQFSEIQPTTVQGRSTTRQQRNSWHKKPKSRYKDDRSSFLLLLFPRSKSKYHFLKSSNSWQYKTILTDYKFGVTVYALPQGLWNASRCLCRATVEHSVLWKKKWPENNLNKKNPAKWDWLTCGLPKVGLHDTGLYVKGCGVQTPVDSVLTVRDAEPKSLDRHRGVGGERWPKAAMLITWCEFVVISTGSCFTLSRPLLCTRVCFLGIFFWSYKVGQPGSPAQHGTASVRRKVQRRWQFSLLPFHR